MARKGGVEGEEEGDLYFNIYGDGWFPPWPLCVTCLRRAAPVTRRCISSGTDAQPTDNYSDAAGEFHLF